MIACLLIPYFAAAVERQKDSTIRSIPLIINAPSQDSRQVFAMSAEAAHCGVTLGMSLRQAHVLCPQARLISADLNQYYDISNQLLELLAEFTPKVEPDNNQLADVIYSDFESHSRREQVELAEHISQAIQTQTDLIPTLGLANGKFPAYIAAASIGLKRVLFIAPGQESSFLAPISVTNLPLDQQLARRFQLLGLHTLGQLATLSAGAVLTQFGKHGHWLHQLAQGRDNRPVQTYPSQPAEQLQHDFDNPVDNWTALASLGQVMVRELATRLETSGRMGRVLNLTLQLEDGTRWSEQLIMHQPTHSSARLAKNLAALVERAQVASRVVALTVRLTDLVPMRAAQLELFTSQNQIEQEKRLHDLLSNLTARYGPDRFYEAVLTNPLASLPEHRFKINKVKRG